ncbi:MAG TPA: hypothetical protein VF761_17175 [Gemmatimonadaceae bacterium]
MENTDTKPRTGGAPVIDVPSSASVPAVRNAQPVRHIEPDMDAEIDAKLGLMPEVPETTGHEVTVSPHFKIATPFPKEVLDALRLFRNIPDEMIDIKPNGQIYLSNRFASEIFDEVFGIGGWGLLPGRSITERKVMKRGTTAEYEIITYYQTWKAYALGQYIRDVSGAGVYFSNNPEMNFSDAVEAAESYAINRLAKRLGIGRNLRDPIFAAEWVAKYAFEDPAVTSKDKWKKRPAAGGVPVPPSGSRSWTAALVKLFVPVVGEDAAQLADALEKLTTKAWGIDRASRSFRDLKNHESYELCRRIAAGELAVPTIAPRRTSDAKHAQEVAKWPPARRDEWQSVHEGEGAVPCTQAGCKACRWDEWEMGAQANVQVAEEPAATEMRTLNDAEIVKAMGPAPSPEIVEQARDAGRRADAEIATSKPVCGECAGEGCAMCAPGAGDDEDIPATGDRKAVESVMIGTLCPKPGHGRYTGLFCPPCEDPSLLDDAAAALREETEREQK